MLLCKIVSEPTIPSEASRVVHSDSNFIFFKMANCHCKLKCACCGGEMTADQELEKTIIYKCTECGLSNSVVKDNSATATTTDGA